MMRALLHFAGERNVSIVLRARVDLYYLDCHKNSMLLTDKANNHRALLHSFLCVLDLEYAALRRAKERQQKFKSLR